MPQEVLKEVSLQKQGTFLFLQRQALQMPG
jgi:hypothetical protein